MSSDTFHNIYRTKKKKKKTRDVEIQAGRKTRDIEIKAERNKMKAEYLTLR